jgi:hypothetical protein
MMMKMTMSRSNAVRSGAAVRNTEQLVVIDRGGTGSRAQVSLLVRGGCIQMTEALSIDPSA